MASAESDRRGLVSESADEQVVSGAVRLLERREVYVVCDCRIDISTSKRLCTIHTVAITFATYVLHFFSPTRAIMYRHLGPFCAVAYSIDDTHEGEMVMWHVAFVRSFF